MCAMNKTRWNRRSTWKKAYVPGGATTLVVLVAGLMLEGIVQNRADAAFGIPLLGLLGSAVEVPLWLVAIVLGIIVAVALNCYFSVSEANDRRERMRQALDMQATARGMIGKMTTEIDDLDANTSLSLK